MMAKKRIKFTKTWSPYQSGETAGFDTKQADWFISQGYAASVVDLGASSVVVKSSAAADVAPEIPSPPVKRRRGRPPKIK